VEEFLYVDTSAIERMEELLQALGTQANTAVARALNRALDHLRSQAGKEVSEEYYVASMAVRQSFRLQRAQRDRLQALGISSGRGLSLMRFHPQPAGVVRPQPKEGVSVLYRKGEGRRYFPKAFLATLGSRVEIYERKGKERFPIRRVFGLAIPEMLSEPDISEAVLEETESYLANRLEHEIDYLLGRFG
jgi:hypothetical protein